MKRNVTEITPGMGSVEPIYMPTRVAELDCLLPFEEIRHLVQSLTCGDELQVSSDVPQERVLEAIRYLNPGLLLSFDQNVEESTLSVTAAALRQGHVLVLSPDTPVAMFAVAARSLSFAVILRIDIGTSRRAALTAASALTNGGVIELHEEITKKIAVAVASSLPDTAGLYLPDSMDSETILAAANALCHLNILNITDRFSRKMVLDIASAVPGDVALQFHGRGPFPMALRHEIQEIRASKMSDPRWYNVLPAQSFHYDASRMEPPRPGSYTSTQRAPVSTSGHGFFPLSSIMEGIDTAVNQPPCQP